MVLPLGPRHCRPPLPALLLAALALMMAGAALLPGTALALPPVGETPYSGRFTMDIAGQPVTGTLYHSPDAERREMTVEGTGQVFILRPAAGEALMILPAAKMAMRIPLPPDPGLAAAEAFARLDPQAEGEETVAGEATTIYRTSGEIEGRFWITDDGVVMRMETDTDRGRYTMELLDLERGAQDPALFELPPGVQVMEGMAPPRQ
ncbi:MAG: hypothetical protein WD100_13590 [Tistlia sp.]|uniref:hypothetical protein n=1 Tax=Tistlia sp. TaxID=3057121 RepID=UPI0034A3CD00